MHPDHVAAAEICCAAIRKQGAKAECYYYEVYTPFHNPSHYIDITAVADEKRKLIRFHVDQADQEQIALELNSFRAAQMIHHDYKYVECFIKFDAYTDEMYLQG